MLLQLKEREKRKPLLLFAELRTLLQQQEHLLLQQIFSSAVGGRGSFFSLRCS